MKTDLFDYHLPDALIAQHPAARRDDSRLLVVDRASRRIRHHVFHELPGLIDPDDLLVRNTARVLPARLHARKETGGAVECLLLHPAGDDASWWVLLRPGRRLKPGSRFGVEGEYTAEVVEKTADGSFRVRFLQNRHGSVAQMAEALGVMPLPPYVDRQKHSVEDQREDRERYQTIYARPDRVVAAAAPTAGLHFTPEVENALVNRGIKTAEIVLHVGLGTFRPIETDEIETHEMHAEVYEIPEPTRQILAAKAGGRTIAVGTTSLRALEAFAGGCDSLVGPTAVSQTRIFIRPPARFQLVDGLLTNFHLPRSTLLCLIAAFLTPGSSDGIDWFKQIYSSAIEKKYRFLSYGDSMLIL